MSVIIYEITLYIRLKTIEHYFMCYNSTCHLGIYFYTTVEFLRLLNGLFQKQSTVLHFKWRNITIILIFVYFIGLFTLLVEDFGELTGQKCIVTYMCI